MLHAGWTGLQIGTSARCAMASPIVGGADISGLRQNLGAEQARFNAATAVGDTVIAPVIIGEAADLVHRREPAQVILLKMMSQAEERLRHLSQMVDPIKEK